MHEQGGAKAGLRRQKADWRGLGAGVEPDHHEQRGNLDIVEMFRNCIVVLMGQLDVFTKAHGSVSLGWVQFLLGKLYFG